MKAIKWNFIIGAALLIVSSLMAIADFLQGGPAWPILGAAVGLLIVVLIARVGR